MLKQIETNRLLKGGKKGSSGQLHLFQITARDTGDDSVFDRVKAQIEETLRKEKSEARFQEWGKELRDNAHVEIRL